MVIWQNSPSTATPLNAANLEAAFDEKADAVATTAALALKLDIASAGADATVLVAALAAVTPTIEELIVAGTVRDYLNSTSGSSPILVAPFPLQIISVSLIVWFNDVAASDTNWWEFRLNKLTVGSVGTQIATKNTKVTGGTAITKRVDWNFDTVSWNTTEATLAKGDALQVAGYPTGTPGTVSQPLVTVRYRPL